MAINRDYLGRSFPPTPPYEVTRVKIAEFADAIGDENPLYLDVAAARDAGYPDVIAPPTFPIVMSMRSSHEVLAAPDLGIDYSMVVHGQQRFVYQRPLRAGDVVTCRSTIEEIRAAGPHETLVTRTEVDTTDSEHVCTVYNTLVVRGGASR